MCFYVCFNSNERISCWILDVQKALLLNLCFEYIENVKVNRESGSNSSDIHHVNNWHENGRDFKVECLIIHVQSAWQFSVWISSLKRLSAYSAYHSILQLFISLIHLSLSICWILCLNSMILPSFTKRLYHFVWCNRDFIRNRRCNSIKCGFGHLWTWSNNGNDVKNVDVFVEKKGHCERDRGKK